MGPRTEAEFQEERPSRSELRRARHLSLNLKHLQASTYGYTSVNCAEEHCHILVESKRTGFLDAVSCPHASRADVVAPSPRFQSEAPHSAFQTHPP